MRLKAAEAGSGDGTTVFPLGFGGDRLAWLPVSGHRPHGKVICRKA